MKPYEASIPQVDLPPNSVIKFEAVDPTTGAAVTGVTVQTITLAVDAPEIVREEDVPGFVPLFTYGAPSNS